MRVTLEEFEVRAFFTMSDFLDLITPDNDRQSRRKYRDWLHAANVVRKNAAGVAIVVRSDLEATFPELLAEAGRRLRAHTPRTGR